MNLILWLFIGGLIGWAANVIMRRDAQRSAIFNIWAGTVGGPLGAWLLGVIVGVPSSSEGNLYIASLVASLIGAVVLLSIMNLARQRLVPPHDRIITLDRVRQSPETETAHLH